MKKQLSTYHNLWIDKHREQKRKHRSIEEFRFKDIAKITISNDDVLSFYSKCGQQHSLIRDVSSLLNPDNAKNNVMKLSRHQTWQGMIASISYLSDKDCLLFALNGIKYDYLKHIDKKDKVISLMKKALESPKYQNHMLLSMGIIILNKFVAKKSSNICLNTALNSFKYIKGEEDIVDTAKFFQYTTELVKKDVGYAMKVIEDIRQEGLLTIKEKVLSISNKINPVVYTKVRLMEVA